MVCTGMLASMTKIRFRLVAALALLAVVLAAASPAQAAEEKKQAAKHGTKHAAKKKAKPAAAEPSAPPTPTAQRLGESGAWSAYMAGDSAGRVCYLVGRPEKSEPAGAGRKPPMAMVTHRPSENVDNVVSFVEGYPLKDDSDVALAVGNKKFELFTKEDSAWARTADLDKSIVAALAKGRRAVVKGQPQKGSATIDVYPLAGFPKALALIDKACGIKR
jgi:Invasion associated locus B (IalB) protein